MWNDFLHLIQKKFKLQIVKSCKIWSFHGGDYEEWCLLGCYAKLVLFLVTDSCHPDEEGAKFLQNVGSYKSHTEFVDFVLDLLWNLGSVQKHSNPKCNTLLSEPFRTESLLFFLIYLITISQLHDLI
jgi:hypothetical protein